MRSLLIKAKVKVTCAGNAVIETVREKVGNKKGAIGVGEILSIVLIVAIFGFIIMPQSKTFVSGIYAEMKTWFDGLNIFPTS